MRTTPSEQCGLGSEPSPLWPVPAALATSLPWGEVLVPVEDDLQRVV